MPGRVHVALEVGIRPQSGDLLLLRYLAFHTIIISQIVSRLSTWDSTFQMEGGSRNLYETSYFGTVHVKYKYAHCIYIPCGS